MWNILGIKKLQMFWKIFSAFLLKDKSLNNISSSTHSKICWNSSHFQFFKKCLLIQCFPADLYYIKVDCYKIVICNFPSNLCFNRALLGRKFEPYLYQNEFFHRLLSKIYLVLQWCGLCASASWGLVMFSWPIGTVLCIKYDSNKCCLNLIEFNI